MAGQSGFKINGELFSACLPARYVLCILTFVATCLESSHRSCMNITIVAMVNQTSVGSAVTNTTDDWCLESQDVHEYRKYQMGKYAWNSTTQGIVLGAYYYGYVCSPLIGGRLAEHFGGKWLLAGSILISSLLCLITPSAADTGVAAVVSSRVIMGLLHGTCQPTIFAMFSKWAPIGERTTLLCICKIGESVGMILSLLFSGYLCENGFAGGWPSVFYTQGILGCAWFIFWIILAHNSPDEHPRISEKELEYIKRNQDITSEKKKDVQLPWKEIVTSLPVWSNAITTFTASWGYVILMTKVPTYFEFVLHIPIQENSMSNSLAYSFACVTMFLSGYVSDRLKSKKCCSTTTIRKSFHFVALTGAAIHIALFPSVQCDKTAAVTLLVSNLTVMSLIGGGYFPVPMDMAPQYAGTIYGLVHGVGYTSGILAPLVAGLLLDREGGNILQWNLIFYSSAGMCLISLLVFTLTGSAEIQPWAKEVP